MTEDALFTLMRPHLERALSVGDARGYARARSEGEAPARTFAADSADEPVEVRKPLAFYSASGFEPDDAARYADYFAEGDDGGYPGDLHRHFAHTARAFADATKLQRKQVYADGKPGWRWVKRAAVNGAGNLLAADDADDVYPEDFESFAAREDGETWQTNGRYYKREGGRTRRLRNPNAAEVDAAKRERSEEYKKANEGRTPKEQLIHKKEQAEPRREEARAAVQAAIANPQTIGAKEAPALAEHLHSLTRDEVRELARAAREKLGGLKSDLVGRMMKSLGIPTDEERRATLEQRISELGLSEAEANNMRRAAGIEPKPAAPRAEEEPAAPPEPEPEAPAPKAEEQPPQAEPAKSGSVAALDDEAFAKKVQQVADDQESGFGYKVFIGDVYNALKAEDPTLTRDQFNEKLLEANRQRKLTLSRADLVQLMDPDAVRESQVKHPGGVGDVHFITAKEKQRKERGRPDEKPAADKAGAGAANSEWAKSGQDRITQLGTTRNVEPGMLADTLRNYARNDAMLATPTGQEVDRLAREHIAKLTPDQQRELADLHRADVKRTGEVAPALKDLLDKFEPAAHKQARTGALARLDKVPGLSPEQKADYQKRIEAVRGDSDRAVNDAAYGITDEAMRAVKAAQAQQPKAPEPAAKPAPAPKIPAASALKSKPLADKQALTALAAAATSQEARDYLETAAHNVPGDKSTFSPADRRHQTVERLAAAHRDALKDGKPEAAAEVAKVLAQFGGKVEGAAGDKVVFDPARYEAPVGTSPDAPMRVVRPAVVGPDGRLAVKGELEPVGAGAKAEQRPPGASDKRPTAEEMEAASRPASAATQPAKESVESVRDRVRKVSLEAASNLSEPLTVTQQRVRDVIKGLSFADLSQLHKAMGYIAPLSAKNLKQAQDKVINNALSAAAGIQRADA